MIKGYKGNNPVIDSSVFIAGSADIIGNVTIGKNSNVWYNVVIRGDENNIVIGENSNIQDGTVIHIEYNKDTVIGNNVTVGHKALIHGCTIGDNTLIGMGSIILGGVEIGEYTLVAAGSLIPPNKKIPSGVLVKGAPAQVVRELTEEEKQNLVNSALKYVETANNYK
ncbi:gamma carbonic anhydrase family protein [Paraclostridium bifermentans]|uniref:gamma carbonic anhydrase family protein n=1 Tax=Paraclostridium bifermentans TaxID=1490 RepID=UPI0024317797|nr:gamma carbonic anhydrase family protein [Paraclostridium bifermentans]